MVCAVAVPLPLSLSTLYAARPPSSGITSKRADQFIAGDATIIDKDCRLNVIVDVVVEVIV